MTTLELDDVNCLVRGRHGYFLANRYDHYLGEALIQYGEVCEIEHRFITHLLGPGDFVVEAGANTGTHTIGLAKTVGPAGAVIAFEPQPAIFQVLNANLALNAVQHVTAFMMGCGNRSETMSIPRLDYQAKTLHNSGSVALGRSEAGVRVQVVPLDDILDGIPSLRLLKVDVEGMERDVLEGAARLIERHRPILYVENDRAASSKALIDWIVAAGYRLWWHTPALFNPDNFFGATDNLYPNVVSLNMFCQPREAAVPAATGLVEITNSAEHPLAP